MGWKGSGNMWEEGGPADRFARASDTLLRRAGEEPGMTAPAWAALQGLDVFVCLTCDDRFAALPGTHDATCFTCLAAGATRPRAERGPVPMRLLSGGPCGDGGLLHCGAWAHLACLCYLRLLHLRPGGPSWAWPFHLRPCRSSSPEGRSPPATGCPGRAGHTRGGPGSTATPSDGSGFGG